MSLPRRLRAYAGLWALVAVAGLVLLALLAAAPRTGNRIADEALRSTLASAQHTARDLLLTGPVPAPSPDPRAARPTLPELLTDTYARLPEPLPALVGERWGATRTGLVGLGGPGVTREPQGRTPKISLMAHTGLTGLRLVDGTAPRTEPGGPTQVLVAEPVARDLGVHTGGEYEVGSFFGQVLRIRVAGRFVPPDGPAWAPYPTLTRTGIVAEGAAGDRIDRRTAVLLTDEAGLATPFADPLAWGLVDDLRYRVDEGRADAADVPALRSAVARLRTAGPEPRLALRTGLADLLTDYTAQGTAARALLAVVLAGIAGTVGGLLLVGARLAVDRRHGELALLRARGAAPHRLAARLLAEAAVTVAPAVAAGWLLGTAVPGRAPADGPLVPVLAALLAVAAVPVAGALAHRRTTTVAARTDLTRTRPTPLRATAELTVAALAVAGVVLARRRGLAPEGVDPYLASVPVLAGAAAGLAALRVLPTPVRVLGRFAARSRGGAVFLGLARAGRAPAVAALPLVVLVLAVAVGGFAASVRAGVEAARDVAAVRLVGGDLRLSTAAFAADAADRTAAVPGVSAVAAGYLAQPDALRVARGAPAPAGIAVLLLDVPAYQRVLDRSGAGVRLPAALSGAPAGDVVPAVVSTGLAREAELSIGLAGDATRRLRTVGVLDALPGLPRGGFVVVPRAAFPTARDRAGVLFVAGPHADAAALRAAAGAVPGATPDDPAGPGGPPGSATADPADVTLLARVGERRALDRAGFNGGIALAFTVSAGAALLAGALAVGLALAAGAAGRARTMSVLRTLGLGTGQARLLLLLEIAPWLVTALVAGAALGLVLPALLAPALGLTTFAAGAPVPVGFDARWVGLLALLLAVLAAVAALAGSTLDRRRALGGVLRLDR